MYNNRLRSYAMWVSIFAFIPMFVEALTTYNIYIYLPTNYETLITAILGLLVLFGVINNPTTKSPWYKDDEN